MDSGVGAEGPPVGVSHVTNVGCQMDASGCGKGAAGRMLAVCTATSAAPARGRVMGGRTGDGCVRAPAQGIHHPWGIACHPPFLRSCFAQPLACLQAAASAKCGELGGGQVVVVGCEPDEY